jgi:flagellar basal body-associated protein FliL
MVRFILRRLRKEGTEMTKGKSLYVLSLMVLAFLIMIAVLNYTSFNYAQKACIDNNKSPIVDKTFLALNWTVSCQ